MNLLVAYDISDDACRLRISSTLSRHGLRVQRSVFDLETRLDIDRFRELIEGAQRGSGAPYDSVLIQPLCDRCQSNRLVIGHDAGSALAEPFWII